MIHKAALSILLLSFFATGRPPQDPVALEQRMEKLETQSALLGEFKQQQRDYNGQLDDHMTHHMDDMIRQQGMQDSRIGILESRINVVYAVGDAGIWMFGLVLTAFYFYNGRKYREQQRQHEQNQQVMRGFMLRFRGIERALHIEPPAGVTVEPEETE